MDSIGIELCSFRFTFSSIHGTRKGRKPNSVSQCELQHRAWQEIMASSSSGTSSSPVDPKALGTSDDELDQVIDQYMRLSPADKARVKGATLRRKEHPEAPSDYPCVMGDHPGEIYEVIEQEEMHPIFMNDEQIQQEAEKGNSYVRGLAHSDYSDEQGPMELAASNKARGNESFKRGKQYYAQALRFYNVSWIWKPWGRNDNSWEGQYMYMRGYRKRWNTVRILKRKTKTQRN